MLHGRMYDILHACPESATSSAMRGIHTNPHVLIRAMRCMLIQLDSTICSYQLVTTSPEK